MSSLGALIRKLDIMGILFTLDSEIPEVLTHGRMFAPPRRPSRQ